MKIKKGTILGILQYLCDINEFGFEDENIDSIDVWAEKAESILYKLRENEAEFLVCNQRIRELEEALKAVDADLNKYGMTITTRTWQKVKALRKTEKEV